AGALRRTGHPPTRQLNARFEADKRKILADFPEIERFYFPPDYVVRSVDQELAQVRCKLSRGRLNFQMWNRTGHAPPQAGCVKLCSPPPGGPLIFWRFAFAANDARLNQSQLSEIELMAGGFAKNPRTRKGLPLLTITGEFAPGENPSVGDARAV